MTARRVLVAATMIAACAAGQQGAAHAAAPARCQTANLVLAPDYSEGAAGHASLIFLLHNRGGQSCTLFGYPGAQLLDGRQQPLPTHVQWGSGGTPPRKQVVIASGADAYFSLEWSAIPTGSEPCPAATFIRVTPPNATVSTIAWLGQGGIRPCGGKLIASPVEADQFVFGVVPTS